MRKIKFWDKLKAIELLARAMSMLTDKHEVTGQVTLLDLLKQAEDKEGKYAAAQG